LTATLTKSLDAAHHRWQRNILGISWKDSITNVEVRARTGQQTMDYFAGLDMSSVWTTSAYHSKHCTGRYQDTREDQVNQERTGGAWSAKTYERWGSPGRKQRWQLLTDTDGVGVWPNVSSWIRDESRSRSSSNTTSQLETGSELGRQVSNLHYV